MAYNTAYSAFAPYSEALAKTLTCIANRVTATAGVVIKAGASAIAKTGAGVLNYAIAGKIYTIAAATDIPLTSVAAKTIAAGYARVFFVFVNAAGTQSIVASESVLVANIATVSIMPDYDMSTLVPVCAIKWTNATASTTVTPGTTALDLTDAVATYVNLSAPVVGQAI